MTAAQDMIRGRTNVVTMTNNSGGALVAGDVCIQDTSADEKVTTTTSAASVAKVFIAAESIASGAAGKFYSAGYCPLVTPSASVTRGRYLFTHTVAKQAAENATYGSGAFGVILKAGTTPSVWLFASTAQGSGGGVARSGSTTDGHLAVWNGSDADSIKDGGVVSSGLYNAYVHIREQQAQNTAGGTFSSGAFRTRVLTTEVSDTAGIASLASNQITLAAGTYRCLISAPAVGVDAHQAQLYNITGSAVILLGTTEWASGNATATGATRSIIAGRFTLSGSTVMEVQHRCLSSRNTDGFGHAGNFATEVYTVAEFWRES